MKTQNSKLKTQNFKSKFKTFYLLVLLLTFALCLLPFPANAQEFATGINPSILFIETEPPARIEAPISLSNQSDQTITYGIFLRPFKANSEKNGTPNYDPKLVSRYEEFFEGVQIQESDEDITEITLGPRQSKDLMLRIRVEVGQPPQDRYFTVVFLAKPQEGETKTNLASARAGIGTNVLLSIGQKSEPRGRITEFSSPAFLSKGPVPFKLELANPNDYYVVSEGNVVIKNMFGQIVGNLEFGPLSILADSNRLVTNGNEVEGRLWWDEEYPIGIYTAEAKVALSEEGPLLVAEKAFIAFPFEVAAVIALVIFSLVLKIESFFSGF